MTSYEIRRRMRYYEDMVQSGQSNIRDLESKIRKLNSLQSKFDNLQSDFAQKQNKRKNNLTVLETHHFNIKLAENYVSGMKSLLSGKEFCRAYNGLTTARERVNQEIRSLQNNIYNENNKITSYNRTLSNLRYQLKIEISKEG